MKGMGEYTSERGSGRSIGLEQAKEECLKRRRRGSSAVTISLRKAGGRRGVKEYRTFELVKGNIHLVRLEYKDY